MSKGRWIGIFCTGLLAGGIIAGAQNTPGIENLARNLTHQMAAKQFEAVSGRFTPTMSSALPEPKLAQIWTSLTQQVGDFQSIADVTTQEDHGFQVALVTTQFVRTTLTLKWVFDTQGKVAGFFITPGSAAAAWTPPAYAESAKFHEIAMSVGSVPWQLKGTLALPNGPGPFPAVVLVQGSGGSDEDETIGPNKPFRDLAWGLASRGIAVLRYNKRTYQYGWQIAAKDAGFTVNQESVEDARAAVALLATQSWIDPKHIFVAGHSLGGMLAPRIAAGEPRVAGLIILAGNTRPLEQIVVEQLRYIAGLQGRITPEAQKQIDAAEQSARQIESASLQPDSRVNFAGANVPGSYFLDLRTYRPAEVAAGLNIPMLILRGERDYQVRAEDTAGWKKALAGKPGVTFIDYPGLYHLFMTSTSPGSGLATPADYQHPGHVAEPVVRDIAQWVRARSRP